jgi:AcrR family transcriptional regulator
MRIIKSPEVRRTEILECAIIGRLGISKGAFYHHFQSKEDLIEALAARYAEEAAAAARPILEDESLDSYSRLAAFLASMRQQKIDAAPELRTTFEPLFRPENLQLYHRTQRAITDVVRPILARIIAQGIEEKCFDVPDADAAAEVILGLMTGTRGMMVEVYNAKSDLERRRQMEKLATRMRYLATVIDRILGVPEGSFELADAASIEAMLRGWTVADTAA